jgi:7-carboxy-7-deazaguanine synthase
MNEIIEKEPVPEVDVKTLLPLSEIFASPQGEGVYSGTMMTFIRLAGCTVGKPYSAEERESLALPIYQEKCTFADGRNFTCDTDYRVKMRMSVNEILDHVPGGIEHVCFTGGEPLMHQEKLIPLCKKLRERGHILHIETSGTILLDPFMLIHWITVAPKFPVLPAMLYKAAEIKILVDSNFDPKKLPFDLIACSQIKPVYLMPVGDERTTIAENVKLCMEWQDNIPSLRIGMQLHKVLFEATGKLVR